MPLLCLASEGKVEICPYFESNALINSHFFLRMQILQKMITFALISHFMGSLHFVRGIEILIDIINNLTFYLIIYEEVFNHVLFPQSSWDA